MYLLVRLLTNYLIYKKNNLGRELTPIELYKESHIKILIGEKEKKFVGIRVKEFIISVLIVNK